MSDTTPPAVVITSPTDGQAFTFCSGDGTESVRIDEVQGQYITNFKPAAGVHTYTVKVFFGGFEQASTTFTTK